MTRQTALEMINTFAFITGLPIRGAVALLMGFATLATIDGNYYRSHWAIFWLKHEQLAMGYCRKAHCLLPCGKLDGLCTQEHYAHEPLPFP